MDMTISGRLHRAKVTVPVCSVPNRYISGMISLISHFTHQSSSDDQD